MSDIDLFDISKKLFNLLISIHGKAFNPTELSKGHCIPPSHIKVIFYLHCHDSASVSEIGKRLCISKPNMTPIIDKLVSEGFVTRYEDPHDRRVLRVKMTEKSIDFINGVKESVTSQFASKLSVLDKEDLNELSNSVDTIKNILSKLSLLL
ncbi:MarR family transcriptional regulator [Clostridium bornimense]|uniref:MarR family winged helix-turn-helix transcriptional regulator n=1 Tax=Clostridium bornimense TaxID=1216932 RepID=UPI001C10A9B1|nr:MarR family transcriptional regulator [Clostridium bornimense]MBU5317020.1 MarR family transcriptional regulator [Clostridium bornimense]